MKFPTRALNMKWLLIPWGILLVIWAALEGSLWLTIFAALVTVLVILGYLYNRLLRGRIFSTAAWLFICTGIGALVGAGSALLALLLMAIKTGLHAHGPEFSAVEINWIVGQIPLWTLAGLLGGLGIGLLLRARSTQGNRS